LIATKGRGPVSLKPLKILGFCSSMGKWQLEQKGGLFLTVQHA